MNNPINVQNLDFSYNKRKILKNIDIDFEKGKVYGITGPNGSGKSTFLKNIASLLEPQKKKVYVKGTDITEYSLKNLAKTIAFVPQNTAIDFEFTVEDIVHMGRSPYTKKFGTETHEDTKICNEAMEITGTYKFKDRSIKQISGGEMQRVIIARALSQSTQILLLDEPVSQLDIHHQLAIMETLQKLAKEKNIMVVCVLHDLNLAAEFCDEVVLLNEGQIFAKDTPEKVFTYTNIEEVYKVICLVNQNPVSGKPHVILVKSGTNNE